MPELSTALKRYALPALLTVAAAVAVALALAASQQPSYTATATLALRDAGEYSGFLGEVSSIDRAGPTDQTTSGAQLEQTLLTPQVLAGAQKRMRRHIGVSRLRDMLEVRAHNAHGVVDVTARSKTPRLASSAVNAVVRTEVRLARTQERGRFRAAADDTQAQLQALNGQPVGPRQRKLYIEQVAGLASLSAVASPVSIQTLAAVPRHSDTPGRGLYAVVGALLGLVAGGLLTLVRRRLHRTRVDPDLPVDLGMPLAGAVSDQHLGRGGLPADLTPGDVDPFRHLLRRLTFLVEGPPPSVIAVTSAVAAEGKSSVAAGIALAGAMGGRRTALVECDLRRPVIARRWGLSVTGGLADCLHDPSAVDAHLVDVPLATGTLSFLASGHVDEQALELLDTGALGEVLGRVRAEHDLVVIDTAPLLAVGDPLSVLVHVDALLLCVRMGRTTREQAYEAVTLLVRGPDRPTALVTTGGEARTSTTAPSGNGRAAPVTSGADRGNLAG